MKRSVKVGSAGAATSAAVSQLGKAVKRGLVSKARAARLTSRLMKQAKTPQFPKRPTATGVSPKSVKRMKKSATTKPPKRSPAR